MSSKLLYSNEYRINDKISIVIPKLEDILKDEDNYYEAISLIVSTPSDMMVPLDDKGIDFTKISDWDLFCLSYNGLKGKDVGLIFKGLDFKEFELAVNKTNNEVVLWNKRDDIVIDRSIHEKICRFLRTMLCLEKNVRRPANEEAKKYIISKARKKLNRAMKKKPNPLELSQLEKLIIALVNSAEFSYDYESVKNISIYQFNLSLLQVVKRVKYDKLMIGCYAGTVNMQEIDKNELTWI